MPDYKNIQNHCLKIQRLASTLIDDILIYYVAQQDRLNRKAEKQLARYRHITKHLPEAWFNMTLTQYIAHRIFREGGLIKKYISISGLSHLTEEEKESFEFQNIIPGDSVSQRLPGVRNKIFFRCTMCLRMNLISSIHPA